MAVLPFSRCFAAGAAAALLLLAGCDDPVRPDPPAAVNIHAPATLLDVGQSLKLAAAVTSAGGAALADSVVVWTSSDTSRAVVAGGQVTGKAPGQVVIRAAAGAAADSVTLTVETPVAELVVWPADTLHLIRGRSAGLRIEMRDATGRPLSHSYAVSSSVPAIVGVEGSRVTGAQLGAATLTVTAGAAKRHLRVRVVTGARFQLRELFAPGPGSNVPGSLNDLGWVAGVTTTRTTATPVLWRAGRLTEIGPAGSYSSVLINDSGTVALLMPSATEERILLWRDGATRSFGRPVLPGAGPLPVASLRGLNNRGQLVGVARDLPCMQTPCSHAFALRDGELAWLEPGRKSEPVAVNDGGLVALAPERGEPGNGYLLGPEGRRAIPPPHPEAASWTVIDINDRGQVLGTYETAGGQRGTFVWDGTSFMRIEGRRDALDLNNHGDVLFSQAVYRGGQLINLARLETPEWYLRTAWAINDLGQVLASATGVSGGSQHVILSPSGQ